MRAIPKANISKTEAVPVLGQGTYRFGEDASARRREIAALRLGIELGMTLIDTAEMYGDGGAEEVVGEAIAGRRDDVFIVTKFLPEHATKKGMLEACDRSLRRLRTDHIDLYLLHWRGSVPLRRTIEGFALLLEAGKIRYAGVSNFDVSDLEELSRVQDDRRHDVRIVTDQVLYNLLRRGIEADLLPWCRKRRRAVMAYSPLEEGLLSFRDHPALAKVAARHHATAAQVALAWVIKEPGVFAIPKASRASHIRENRAAANIRLSKDDVETLDESFPAPDEPRPLETR